MEKKCDIVLLSYENLNLLKKCIDSIFSNTKVVSHLIVVDNGSQDSEVAKYISTIKGTEIVSVEKIILSENKGFAAGVNIGINIATAPYVCLLNNDCEVTDGWLEEMIKVASSDRTIGLVNPQSSTFGSRPQNGVSYNQHSKSLADKKGKYTELGHSIGFTLLIKREVLNRIGYFDEGYKGFCYEDLDFSVRAHNAGYISVMAKGAYVFHYEQASRKKMPEKWVVYKRNRELFESKWGDIIRVIWLNSSNDFNEEQEFVDFYNFMKKIARNRIYIDYYLPNSQKEKLSSTIVAYFLEHNSHADISLKFFNKSFLVFMSIWKILTKKKKYNVIILKKGVLFLFLLLLKPIHRAKVVVDVDRYRTLDCRNKIIDINDSNSLVSFIKDSN